MKRHWRFFLLTTTIIATPALGYADPISLTAIVAATAGGLTTAAIGGTVVGIIVGSLVAGAIGFLGNLLFAPKLPSSQQRKDRTRQFDPHPPFRFAFGEFPLEGAVVFHHVEEDTERYFLTYLLNSIPSEVITKIEINDGLELSFADAVDGNAVDITNTASEIYDMTAGAWADTPPWWDDGHVKMWIGLGEHTQAPQEWLDEIGPAGSAILKATDVWKGSTVAFVRLEYGPTLKAAARWGQGKPPPLKFYGKWSKVYDPRQDPNSGVTQYGATSPAGNHDIDDRTTWEYSNNPALCALMLATHDYALGFDQEMIPIQQWADAADAWGGASPATATASIDPILNAGYPSSVAVTKGVTISGFIPDQMVAITLPEGQTYGAYSYWGIPSPPNPGVSGTTTLFFAAPDGDETQEIRLGDDNGGAYYDGYEAGRAAFGTQFVTGGSSYTLYILDNNLADNTGGIDVDAEAEAEGCNGLIVVNDRELKMLDPVLDCMAGHLDTTDGLLGVRAGVWVAPTETLSQPVGDEIGVDGARDSGFDTVRAKFIWSGASHEETDGPGYQLRSGSRVHPLHLPMVSSRSQAARLEKIFALRAEPNRTITATWDGREFNRRVGERVNFALDGFARASSSYVIASKRPHTRQVDNGFEVSVEMTLIEDVEATYDWTPGEYTAAETITIPPPITPEVAAPTSVTLEQQDYYDGSGAAARLKATIVITAATSNIATNLRVEITDGAGYTFLANVTVEAGTTSYTVYDHDVIVGLSYTVRARTEGEAAGFSDWTVSNSVTVVTPVIDYSHSDYGAEFA